MYDFTNNTCLKTTQTPYQGLMSLKVMGYAPFVKRYYSKSGKLKEAEINWSDPHNPNLIDSSVYFSALKFCKEYRYKQINKYNDLK